MKSFPIRSEGKVFILSDECVNIFVYCYCHLYYKENAKTTYTEVKSYSIVFSFYAVQNNDKVL